MQPTFPENPQDKKVLAVMKGGIGDCLMIANACSCLTDFTFCVEKYQVPLISKIKGCTAKSLDYFKDRNNHKKYDAVVNFLYFLSTGAALKTGGYYSILEKKIKSRTPLSGIDIPYKPEGGIYVHTQATSPNRDWVREYWEELLPNLAELDIVYLLGRKQEFRPQGKNIVHLCEENEDLLWQVEKLSTAKVFLGVDSGFCHAAGIIGVPGNVLFFNTKANDVISRYSSLVGLDSFNGEEPSRTLKIPCSTSERYKRELKPETVFKSIENLYNSK